jgi:hypothetical protein
MTHAAITTNERVDVLQRLNISPDNNSPEARASVDKILADTLRQSLLSGVNSSDVLSRVGQAGRLWPVLYNVIQPKEFQNVFYGLGVTSNHVENAVKHPDDHQHIMTEGMPSDWRAISLFMKRVISRDAHKSHWLLVQAHRMGADQQVVSAWQIYPDEVNIENARRPIDVLRAFVAVYGVPLKVAETKALFVDSESFPIDAKVIVDWTGAPEDFFVSFAHTSNSDAGILRLGVAYCIDLRKYRVALRKRGVRGVAENPIPAGVQTSQTTTQRWL